MIGAYRRLKHERSAQLSRLIGCASYAPLLVLALVILMCRLFVAAQILTVDEFAIYSAILLVSSSFTMLGCLGLQTMLQREMPVLLHREQRRRAMILLAQAMLVAFACTAIAIIVTMVWPGIKSGGLLDKNLVLVGLVHGLSQQVFVLVTVESRSSGLMMLFSWQYVCRSVAIITAGVIVMNLLHSGISGAAAEAITTLVLCGILLTASMRRTSTSVLQSIHLGVIRIHKVRWRSTTSMFLVMVIAWIIQNADRWTAEQKLNSTNFAIYIFAATLIAVSSSAQMVINASLFPRLARKYAESGTQAAFRSAVAFSAALGALGLIAAPLAWICWEFTVSHWFPRYSSSITIAPMLIVVGVLRVSDYWSSFLIIIGQEARLLRATTISAVIAASAWWCIFGLTSTISITAIVWMALILAAVVYLSVMTLAWKESKRC